MDKITNEELVKFLIDEDNTPLTPLGELRKAELLSRLARVQELEEEVEKLKEQVDFEHNKAGHLEWVKGQRAIEKLERIKKAYNSYEYQLTYKILAEEG